VNDVVSIACAKNYNIAKVSIIGVYLLQIIPDLMDADEV
jgi:hypothetical protein